MNAGKLYTHDEKQFVTDVNYRLLGSDYRGINGELIPDSHGIISEAEEYIVELEDSQKLKCRVTMNVNRPTVGLPPRFVYRFSAA